MNKPTAKTIENNSTSRCPITGINENTKNNARNASQRARAEIVKKMD